MTSVRTRVCFVSFLQPGIRDWRSFSDFQSPCSRSQKDVFSTEEDVRPTFTSWPSCSSYSSLFTSSIRWSACHLWHTTSERKVSSSDIFTAYSPPPRAILYSLNLSIKPISSLPSIPSIGNVSQELDKLPIVPYFITNNTKQHRDPTHLHTKMQAWPHPHACRQTHPSWFFWGTCTLLANTTV